MKDIFSFVLDNYLNDRQSDFKNNKLASKLRNDFPRELQHLIAAEGDRYSIKGSAGQSTWANCPWIAIFDSLVTSSAKSGYYLVYLFKEDMSGFYLSLNQGVTDVYENYKKEVKAVLINKANDYRDRLIYNEKDRIEINLGSRARLPSWYEKGNILARYYKRELLPDDEVLISDFEDFFQYYKSLVYNDSTNTLVDSNLKGEENQDQVEETKRRRLHEKFDRKGDTSLKVKKRKGYKCEVCGLTLIEKYGELGKEYIEAHHLKAFSALSEGKIFLSIDKDFAVLCPNCHRMIHRLPDPSDIEMLKRIINENKKQ
ncbi:MAG: MrcB family domain-containing protein [Dysgonomonas sp.]